jgi:pimeloyl-ACP methyl ester carboxylesterase
MKAINIYSNDKIKSEIKNATSNFRSKLNFSLIDHYIETSTAKTHVIEAGVVGKPVLILLHGGATNGVCALYLLRSLINDFHIFCPDVPGHCGESESKFLSPRDSSYGNWLNETIEGLGITKEVNLMGISYGGFIAQRFLTLFPEKVKNLSLMVPGGIVNPSMMKMLRKVMLPQIIYKITKKQKYMNLLINQVFTDIEDKDLKRFAECIFAGVKIDSRPMKLTSLKDVSKYKGPVLIIGADNDIIFSAKQLKNRSRELYGDQLEFEMLKDSMHSPSTTDESIQHISNKVKSFFYS